MRLLGCHRHRRDDRLDHERSVGYAGRVRPDDQLRQQHHAQYGPGHQPLGQPQRPGRQYALSLPRQVARRGRQPGDLRQLHVHHRRRARHDGAHDQRRRLIGHHYVQGATIGWTTNEASDTQVEYGLTTSYGSSTTLNTALVTSHSASLSGMAANTLYHYRVKSRDAAGNLATSGDFTFTTAATADTTPPTISGVSATGATANGVTIAWTTNEASDTQVEYGLTTSYGSSTILNTALVTNHSVGLSGLTASTHLSLSRQVARCRRQPGDLRRFHVHHDRCARYDGADDQRRGDERLSRTTASRSAGPPTKPRIRRSSTA